jgi:enoyl-CoA hydratase/carnithine racemase
VTQRLSDYQSRFANIAIDREDGILQLRLHTDGGSLRWGAEPMRELQECFAAIADDLDNRVVIVTGTGDEFNGPKGSPETFPRATARGWEFSHWNVRRLLGNLLDIEAPVISAINGPVWRHCETPLLSDVVLASETAQFADTGHFVNGLVPGDGMNLVLPLLMGTTRARYFMLTGQVIDATEAQSLGLVNEVLPPDQLLPRAWELAREFCRRSPLALRYTRVCFTYPIKQYLLTHHGYGIMLEGMAAIADAGSAVGGYELGPRG